MTDLGIPGIVQDAPTAPLSGSPLTAEFVGDYVKREVSRHASETQVSPHDLARALDEIEQLKRTAAEAEKAAREAASPILTWAKKNQKLILWVVLGGGGGTGGITVVRGELQEQAEAAVLGRQAEEAQAKAVEKNTAATVTNAEATENVAGRVTNLESKVEANAELMRTAIEVQLAQPSIKKRIRADDKLKSKVETAVGSID